MSKRLYMGPSEVVAPTLKNQEEVVLVPAELFNADACPNSVREDMRRRPGSISDSTVLGLLTAPVCCLHGRRWY